VWGRLDILVSNAGVVMFVLSGEISDNDVRRIVNTHPLGHIWMTPAAFSHCGQPLAAASLASVPASPSPTPTAPYMGLPRPALRLANLNSVALATTIPLIQMGIVTPRSTVATLEGEKVELDGKAVIVTGGAGNIGSACVRRLASEGAAIVVADLPEADVKNLVDEVADVGGRAIGHEGDISDEPYVMDLIGACLRQFGRIDALINVAAAIRRTREDRDLTTMSMEFWDHVMRVNVGGPMLTSKHAIPAMLSQGGGSIVNFTSTAAFAGDYGLIAYSTSKAALLGLSRSVATTYGRQGIRCNTIAPSGVWPEATLAMMGEERRKLMEDCPLTPRLGVPDDVAHMVVYLASDKASYITGQTLFVDGGGLAHQPWVRPGSSAATD
jgi:NAD(P)-dependent dehydrogenase (short-subunit alcohol dehydrogenase family)